MSNDYIELEDIVMKIWERKYLIASVSLLSGVIFAVLSLFMEETYRVELRLSPVSSTGFENYSSGQLGNLASLTGIRGGMGPNNAELATEVLRSSYLTSQLIIDRGWKAKLFAAKTDPSNRDVITYNRDIYNPDENTWKIDEPTEWDVSQKIRRHFQVIESRDHGFRTLRMDHPSAEFSRMFLYELLKEINDFIREKEIESSNQIVEFIKGSLEIAELDNTRVMLYQALERELQKNVIAKSRQNYVFQPVVPISLPQNRHFPNRILILLLGLVFGLIVSVIFILLSKESNENTAYN